MQTAARVVVVSLLGACALVGCVKEAQQTSAPVASKSEEVKGGEASKQPEQAGSSLEKSFAAKGTTLILGYTELPKLTVGPYGATVEVDARESYNPSSPEKKIIGILVQVNGDSRGRAYVDYDEIDPLLAGIDDAAKATSAVTALKNFEVRYNTRGGLNVTTFSDKNGKVMASISAGSTSRAFTGLEQLQAFRELIVKAKGVIEDAKKTQHGSSSTKAG